MLDFSKPYVSALGNPIKRYRPITIPKATFTNSVRLNDMIKEGKIYLSLSDAIALALENNFDIAIARYDLDIADTDILRTKAGNSPLGVPTGLVTGTLGGSTSTLSTGGGPGGTATGSGGAGSGAAGLTQTTAGAGPTPENLDPVLGSTVSFDRDHLPKTSFITQGTSSTNIYDFNVNQGFVTGTNFQFAFNNTYATTTNTTTLYSPELLSNFKAMLTQHLLQGAGIWSQQALHVSGLERPAHCGFVGSASRFFTRSTKWRLSTGELVQAYEDVQAKQRALDQSSKLLSDDRFAVEIPGHHGATRRGERRTGGRDRPTETSSVRRASLNPQQEIIKQAIARNLKRSDFGQARR